MPSIGNLIPEGWRALKGNSSCLCTPSMSHTSHEELTQTRRWVMTTWDRSQATCRAVRRSLSPVGAVICSLELCASSNNTAPRSWSSTAWKSWHPRDSSEGGNGARNNRCSYLARIQDSRSSLRRQKEKEWLLLAHLTSQSSQLKNKEMAGKAAIKEEQNLWQEHPGHNTSNLLRAPASQR